MPPSRSWATTTRACDSCRRRKVKCDATEMCANCRISRLPCQYTSTPKKRGPKGSGSSTPRVPVVVAHKPQPQPLRSIQEASIEIGIGFGVLHGSYGRADEDHQVWLSPVSCPEQQQSPGEETPTPTPQHGGLATNPRNTFALPVAAVDLGPTAAWAQAIRDGLLVLLRSALLPLPTLQAVNTCIDLYMQYTFPTAPMVHEPTLRASAARFFSSTGATEVFRANSRQEEMANIRAFTLLTAVCASVASVMPESLLPYRQILARPCLDASRDMLKAFEDFDVEHPNSTSIATRILHSTALQQITGKTTLAYYALGQATLLIRHMRLHSEEALKAHDALEMQLLRSMFWQMYAADKASACLGSRPFLIHELLLDEELSPPPSGEPHIPLLDTTKPWYERTFEERLFVGFRFLPRLWSSAASLLFDLKAHGRGNQDVNKTRLTQAYIEFLSIIDDLPHWLQAINVIISRDDGEAARFQKTAFWVQRCTVHVTYQCLRLVILQQCIDSKAWDIMGLNDQVLTLPMTKMGIVHEFVQTLDDIPFIYLQVKGEPTVERIRRVGSVLLEIIDNVSNETIIARAEHYVTRLLDLLARLESKSSDVLTELKELSQARLGSRPSGQRCL